MAYLGILFLLVFGVGLIGCFLFKLMSHEEHTGYSEQYSTGPVEFRSDVAVASEEVEAEADVSIEEKVAVADVSSVVEEPPVDVVESKDSGTMWGKALSDASDVLGQLDGVSTPAKKKPRAKKKVKPKAKRKTATKKKAASKPKAKKKPAVKKSPSKKKATAKKKAVPKPKAKKKS